MKLCECGCGRGVKKGENRFINGHNHSFIGKHHSKKALEKMSVAKKGKLPPNTGKTYEELCGVERAKHIKKEWSNKRKGKLPPITGKHHSLESKEKSRKSHLGKKIFSNEEKEKRRQRMLNGLSAYANSFNKDQSREELQLRDIVLDFYPNAIPQYKVLKDKNYRLDIAVVELKIAIEFDGWHHFRDQEHIDYHNRRQQEIETECWKFVRYNIFQPFPTKEQFKEDIERVLKND